MLSRWSWARFPILLFIGSRGALLVFSSFANRLPAGLLFQEELAAPLGDGLRRMTALQGLCRWDCGWFEKIARDGYQQFNDSNFWPLYPLLARGLSAVTGMNIQVSLIVLANLASLLALLVIFRIFRDLEGEEPARAALMLFVAYPFAFFQAAAYPESLLIFFTALSILLALRGHHLAAGAALGMGVLARHLTIVFGGALLTAQVNQRGIHPRKLLWHPAVLGLALPFALGGIYLLFLRSRFGDPFAFWVARERGWGESAWWGLWHTLKTDGPEVRHWTYLLFSLVPGAGAVMLATRRRWAELAASALCLMLLLYAVGAEALGRYSASCWPAFLPLGVWLAKRPALQGPLLAGLALFQGLFFYLFIHQFAIV